MLEQPAAGKVSPRVQGLQTLVFSTIASGDALERSRNFELGNSWLQVLWMQELETFQSISYELDAWSFLIASPLIDSMVLASTLEHAMLSSILVKFGNLECFIAS